MSIQDALCFCRFILIAFFGIGCLVRGNSMRDQLKDRAIDLIKETWAQGYEAGVHATNVDCGVVWEERIDEIKAEAEKAKEQVYDAPQDVYEPDFYVREGIDFVLELIDKHCGGE